MQGLCRRKNESGPIEGASFLIDQLEGGTEGDPFAITW